MPSLIEMMQMAQGGNAMDNLARQFGLTPQQTESAVSALMPAFSMGLQQNANNMSALGGLFQTMFSGPHNAAYESAQAATSPQAVNAGSDVLSQLFGPQAMQRQVAQHAAAMSGVSSSILQQMMPVIASMVMGALFKGTMNSGLGGILGQIFGQGAGQAMPMPGGMPTGMPGGLPGGLPGGMSGGMGGMLGEILGQMMGQGSSPQPQPSPQQAPQGMPGGSLGDILAGMFDQMTGQSPASSPSQPSQPDAEPAAPNPMSSGIDILKSMFEAGTQVQDAHLKGLQDIFDKMNGPAGQR